MDNHPWFAAKRLGYGAGVPITWQGWAIVAAHIALIIAATRLFGHHPGINAVLLVALIVAPFPLYAAKTRGGWKWRSGGK